MIVVTHEMAFARDVADQIVVMDAGQVVEHGAAEEVLLRPRPAYGVFPVALHSTKVSARLRGVWDECFRRRTI